MTGPLTLQDARDATERGEALPCRWCGEERKMLTGTFQENNWVIKLFDGDGWGGFECVFCEQHGPRRFDYDEALRCWNAQQIPRSCEGKPCA